MAEHISETAFYHLFVMDPKTHKSASFSYKTRADRQEAIADYKSKGWQVKTTEGANSFQNGRLKAEKYLNERAGSVGVKFENDKTPTAVGWYVTDLNDHIKAGPMSEMEAQKKRDANPDKLDIMYISDYDLKRIKQRD